jgi:VWFA-related protein
MRKLSVFLLLAGAAMPALAAKTVTVEQLEQVLAAAHGKSDAKVAQQLSGLELTERLSAVRLSRWEADLPGPESRQSLVLLADLSAFLDPPAAEIPAAATPDFAAQRRIVALTVDYASRTIHQLPNFFATRDTVRFEDSPQGFRADTSVIPYQPLHTVGRSTDTVLYRDGNEVVDSRAAKGKEQETAAQGLTTSGVFGPILGTVLVDAAHGKLAWSHWEQGAAGPEAVFRFAVPREKSHYEVEFCCVPGDSGKYRVFQQFSGYHGEMAVDPVNGSILRLTLQADLTPADKMVRSDILVEYGSVEIGGRSYICPVRSVSISDAPMLPSNALEVQRYRGGALLERDSQSGPARLRTSLNDVVFDQYHLFRAEAHILSADSVERNGHPSTPSAGAADAVSGDAGSVEAGSTRVPAVAGGATNAAGVDNAAALAAPALVATAPAPTPAPVAEPAVPEINVTEASGLPELPATPGSARDFTLHVTTRLVDVGVVAYDKKGHPVTDLKREDFEIYDNGRKQIVQYFSSAGVAADESVHPTDQPVFSNRRAEIAGAATGGGAVESSITILLIDAGNLAWADLTHAREEMLKFLRTLPADQRAGIYVLKASGFQILAEGTADHALLESKLREWMPGAQDLAQAQEMEQRNRQAFDEVRNPTDLQFVNGNSGSVPETASPVDPKLRDDGSHSERDALALPVLIGVAQHLGAIPGHKNLVWVTSDNVLVDWTDKAVSSDKGMKHIDGMTLRAQEALNDAHVSIYPLDASQLETMAIDPGLKSANIELAPGVSGPPPVQGGAEKTGRMTAEMQQDLHPIQIAIQDMATATGGRAVPRAGDMAAELGRVVEDGRATYLLSFTPGTPADNQYHMLTVKVATRRDVRLRYRTGYQYAAEPSTLKDRFRQAIWQPLDVNEIAVTANPVAASAGTTLRLNIATNDLAMKQQGDRWVDKLDIFVVQREDDGLHARIAGQTLGLALKPPTYQSLLGEGIPFEQRIERKQDMGSLRIVVVDENSGRMGSVTVPASMLRGKL